MQKRVFFLPVLLGVFILTGLSGCLSAKKKNEFRETNLEKKEGIDQLTYFHFGPVPTAVLERTAKPGSPILLFVHDGPGMPDMPYARRADSLLVNSFHVIHYDQRGCGLSAPKDKTAPLKLKDYADELLLLADTLRKIYPEQSLILVGYSWGSVVSMEALRRRPELFSFYIGIAQVSDWRKAREISLSKTIEMAKATGNEEALVALNGLNPVRYCLNADSLAIQRSWLRQLGGEFYDTTLLVRRNRAARVSPEYTRRLLRQTRKRAPYLEEASLSELRDLNLMKKIKEVPVPMVFIGGRHDLAEPSEVAEKFLSGLKTPYRKFLWYENSGHAPHLEEAENFYTDLLGISKEMKW